MPTTTTTVSLKDMVNPEYLSAEKRAEMRAAFQSGKPCPYLALDTLLLPHIAKEMYDNFPKIEDLQVKRKSLNENKVEDYHFERWHPVFQQVRSLFMSEEFCQFMSDITGIDGLFVTEDNTGSGLHQGTNGSHVDIHIDFNMSARFNAWRRINLLLYLNPHWKDEYGGHLELWDKDMKSCEVKIAPNHNRGAMFLTDENSPHGYNKITLPEGETRKSFYVYFYTPWEEGVEFRDSKFISRPDDGFVKKTLTSLKESIKIPVKRLLFKLGIKDLDFQDKNK